MGLYDLARYYCVQTNLLIWFESMVFGDSIDNLQRGGSFFRSNPSLLSFCSPVSQREDCCDCTDIQAEQEHSRFVCKEYQGHSLVEVVGWDGSRGSYCRGSLPWFKEMHGIIRTWLHQDGIRSSSPPSHGLKSNAIVAVLSRSNSEINIHGTPLHYMVKCRPVAMQEGIRMCQDRRRMDGWVDHETLTAGIWGQPPSNIKIQLPIRFNPIGSLRYLGLISEAPYLAKLPTYI
ncbi:hypothetical protein QBC35DRAFT_83970 [Podospora australis]|uniref:Uncharacterized protein n=1 Tax=Podospora australis TaxID=1536484 RepID=A0AAN7AE30_9PEZI|nr:hypothetical protein QBC35DRAFT_83970 [Podospora australis]